MVRGWTDKRMEGCCIVVLILFSRKAKFSFFASKIHFREKRNFRIFVGNFREKRKWFSSVFSRNFRENLFSSQLYSRLPLVPQGPAKPNDTGSSGQAQEGQPALLGQFYRHFSHVKLANSLGSIWPYFEFHDVFTLEILVFQSFQHVEDLSQQLLRNSAVWCWTEPVSLPPQPRPHNALTSL